VLLDQFGDGPNTLLIEGAADLLYIQGMSALLEREGRQCLSPKWTLAPVGGSAISTKHLAALKN
jgi:hypothetical protein